MFKNIGESTTKKVLQALPRENWHMDTCWSPVKKSFEEKIRIFFLNRIEIFFWCFQKNLGEGGFYNFNINGYFTLCFSMDLSYGNNTKDITGSLHSVPKQIKLSCRWPRLKSLINLIDIQSLICSLHQLYFMNLFSF